MRAHWFQHVPFEGLGSIETWLRDAHASITATRFHEDARLPRLDDVDVLIVMGGPMSVNDDERYPWLAVERRFIRDAIERGTPVLGVCLGAQLIARAMDARVYANHEREIGWYPISGVSTDGRDPSWATAGAETTVFHWHGETFDLPHGTTYLARSAGCEHQAFRLGEHVVGIQFHLETTPDAAAQMVTHGRDELTPGLYVQSEREILSASAARFASVNQLMAQTLQSLLA